MFIPSVSLHLQVKISNMVFNSSEVVKRNVQSWPPAPPPVLVNVTLLNAAFAVMVTLDERHVDIISLFIEVIIVSFYCACVLIWPSGTRQQQPRGFSKGLFKPLAT